MDLCERHLPRELLERASLRGNEYAWPVADIPKVIEAAREAELVSIGGQLQFRLPNATCELYWVEVDTFKSVAKSTPWKERVARTAEVALADFAGLASKFNFLDEGKRSFGTHLKEFEERGGDPANTMCFVWYLLDRQTEIEAE